ncbi:MAG TPA: hydrolase, partial [Verrucomicrobiae bacterium]|nr:hydrolase [Verrucomicrobiae bacterium]
RGKKVVELALHAEFQGAMAVVLNAPTPVDTIVEVSNTIDIPIISTTLDTDVEAKLEGGAQIINVSASSNTPALVKELRRRFPDLPIIATGGTTEDSILRTIDAGANAVTYTPPSIAELMKNMMHKYRGQ